MLNAYFESNIAIYIYMHTMYDYMVRTKVSDLKQYKGLNMQINVTLAGYIIQTFQLSRFWASSHGLTSSYDFSMSVLNSRGDSWKLVLQPE